ncbi:hypothetical protein [Leifsonia poae]|uniref:Lipoprotein n=1 Tax=Leifsonia poae TaxID=110933 RepID=A0A9W6HDE2_9MICO|nr:hypothetical protein [Leifsonia poae]GLJ78262.1 hypothetical protein GCM10017584_38360 [Leifsonia poae]
MARNVSRLKQFATAAATLAAVGLLVGCAATASAHPDARSTATPTPEAVTVPMPDLGPSPAPAPQTAAQTEQLRIARADEAWKQLVQQYPSAVRPQVTFDGYISDATEMDVMTQCYTEQKVPIALGYPAGAQKGDKATSVGAETTNEQEAIGAYVCNVEHPYPPTSPMTQQQLGWLYDYLTRFLAPCYQANGIANPPAPSRADFIAKWPHQNWFPSDGGLMDGPRAAAIVKACPSPK